MNQQIIEFAEQAGYDINRAIYDPRIEEFARLIIDKCAEIASSSLRNGVPEVYIKEYFEDHE